MFKKGNKICVGRIPWNKGLTKEIDNRIKTNGKLHSEKMKGKKSKKKGVLLHYFKDGRQQCSKCREIKELNHFAKDSQKVTGYCSWCRECTKKRTILRKYSLSFEEYEKLYSQQEGKCKICGEFQSLLNIDHNHQTGKFRGLLCQKCNFGIGLFKDDKFILEKAIKYLEEGD